MKILGIDTTTKFLSLGLYDNNKIYEYNLELYRKHATLLTVTIKRVLDALGWQPGDIDYFACGSGPGSFTGMRIGLATIKGLAWSLNKPALGISTLDILARNAASLYATVVPIIDAKRNLIYCSAYKKAKSGSLKRITPYMLLTEKDFFSKIKAKHNIAILGDAVNLYKQKLLTLLPHAAILDRDYWYPKPRHIIALALERIKESKLHSPFKIKPIYLYPKECQIKNSN